MLELLLLIIRTIGLVCRGRRDLLLENMALRHQLRTLQRSVPQPRFRTRDRMFWVLLARAWRRWRSALVLVQPETVIRWHREWLRRRWARCSGRNRAETHLRRLLRTYLAYYHRTRTHLALSKDAPDSRPASSAFGTIVATPEVGGLHHRYERHAA